MKKTVTIIIAGLLILSMAGCGSTQETSTQQTQQSTASAAPVQQAPQSTAEESPAAQTAAADSSSSSAASTEAWKQFLKDYEAWADSYVEFMKKYKENPSDLGLIGDYGNWIAETAEWAEKAEKYEDDLQKGDVTPEIISEYMNTLSRITKKIAEVAN